MLASLLDCKRAMTRSPLHRAFDEENLLLYYQPIHDARTRKIVAAEALMRQRRENGEIRPAQTITEEAEDGAARDLFALDEWMMRTAYAEAAKWQALAPDVRLHVNLSPREFQEGNVLPRLEEMVKGCGISTNRINLEITEVSQIENPEETTEVLDELKKLGIQLWLDDFGSGHSTLEHVLHFPIDGIKIAKTFITDLPGEERSAAITSSMIALAHELNVKVIAEGVEREEQLQFLLDRGCDSIQGFLFTRPMPRGDFEALLRR
jgi:EAL domain-containing protein (putative c-di-GMP-specific phosphodiesterase class I)